MSEEPGKVGLEEVTRLELLFGDELTSFRETFGLFDKDGDGNITKKELSAVFASLSRLGVAYGGEKELDQMIQEVDVDGDGTIDWEEFLKIMLHTVKGQGTEEDVLNAFKVFDTDEDRKLSAAELRHIMTTLGERFTDDQVDEMLKEADVDKLGFFDYKRFVFKLYGKPMPPPHVTN